MADAGALAEPSASTRWARVAICGCSPRWSGNEPVEAVVATIHERRGWVAAVTPRALHLARDPVVAGRRRTLTHPTADLSAVRATELGVDLQFGAERVALTGSGPHRELARLLDCLRRQLDDADDTPGEALRAMAERRLGRFMAFAHEASIDGLPTGSCRASGSCDWPRPRSTSTDSWC